MFRFLFLFMSFLFLAGLLISWLAGQDGMTSIIWLGWHIQTPTSLLVVIALFMGVVLIGLYRLIGGVLRLPSWLKGRWHQRQLKQGERALGLGMVAFAAGEHLTAQKHAKRAEKLLPQSILSDLLLAQSAHATGDEKAALRYFTALSNHEDTAYFGHIGLMRLHQTQGHATKSLDAAQKALTHQPHSSLALIRLCVEDMATKNWEMAEYRLRILLKQNDFPYTEGVKVGQFTRPDLLHAHIWLMQAEAGISSLAGADRKQAEHAFKSALNAAPDFIEAGMRYAEFLSKGGQQKPALRVLENLFKANPHAKIAASIAVLSGDTGGHLVARLGRLTEKSTHQDRAMLITAETALDKEIWGAAHALLEAIARPDRTNHYYLLLARLAEHYSIPEINRDKALHDAALAPHAPHWHCLACHAGMEEWHATCPTCTVFGQSDWRTTNLKQPALPPTKI